jgi:hypothetical protein
VAPHNVHCSHYPEIPKTPKYAPIIIPNATGPLCRYFLPFPGSYFSFQILRRENDDRQSLHHTRSEEQRHQNHKQGQKT